MSTGDTSRRGGLTALAVSRPVTILMVLGFLVVAGVVAFTRLPVRRLPNVNYPFIRVVIGEPGANALTMSQTITTPVEKALSSESGVVSMVGTSSPGRSVVALQFVGGTNVDQAAASVSLAIARIAKGLPPTATPPSIIKANPSALPMMNIAVSGPLASSQLYTLATNVVAPSIQELSGVAQVTVVGGRAPVVSVDISPKRLAAYGLSVTQVTAALKAQNVAVTGGLVVVGSQELLSRTHGGYTSVAQLQSLPIDSRPGGAVLLGQVATIAQGLAQAQSAATLNGIPAVGLVVTASSTANSLAVDNEVRATLATIDSQLPSGVSTTITGDVTNYVRAALSNVELDLFLGILFAALVLAVFLHRMANTVIVMLAIPVSLISTFAVMYFLGFSLDLISLMALSLLIGILVDDSIVVLENIHRHKAMGKNPGRAAIDGRREIGAAAVAITLTDVVVFAPVAFVSGNVGQLFREFGLTIVAATLFSLLVSYTLTPMLASRWGTRQASASSVGARFGGHFDAGFERLRSGYRRVIGWSLGHRLAVIGVAVAAAATAVGILRSGVLPTTFVPPEDNGVLTINATLPVGTPLATAQATLDGLGHRLQGLPGVTEVFLSAGYEAGAGAAYNVGQLTVDLGPRGSRPPIKAYTAKVQLLASRYPGLIARAHVQSPFIAGGSRAASVSIVGPDLTVLDGLATQVAADLAHSSAVSQVSTSIPLATPELSVQVNQAAAAYLGVSTTTIGDTIAAALGGVTVPPLVVSPTAPAQPVKVNLGNGTNLTPAQLGSIGVGSADGVVPLSAVANLTETAGPGSITQTNGQYSVSVSASSTSGNSGPATAAILSAAHSVGLPTGYSLKVGGESAQQSRAFGPLIQALGLSILLVYMLMAALYESVVDPLAILFAVPLAIVGALGGLWVAHLPISIFALIAMIMLIGLVSKNSILLIDYTKTLRRRGSTRTQAVIESGSTRIRPIIMTTATMIFAMVPLALGTGSGASERRPVGVVLIGGLLSSTLLSLLVVPVLYTLFDDGAAKLSSLRRRVWRSAPNVSSSSPEGLNGSGGTSFVGPITDRLPVVAGQDAGDQ